MKTSLRFRWQNLIRAAFFILLFLPLTRSLAQEYTDIRVQPPVIVEQPGPPPHGGHWVSGHWHWSHHHHHWVWVKGHWGR